MHVSHYHALLISYAVALGCWLVADRFAGTRWKPAEPAFDRPASEFGFALLTVPFIIGIGQLYVHDLLIPPIAPVVPLTGSINQILIFSPIILLLVLRRHPPESAWLQRSYVPERLGFGLLLALFTMVVFLTVRDGSRPIPGVFADTFSPDNLPHLVQVFLEDISIAIIFVRLRAWIGTRWSIGIVATLFAAAHIPAMLAEGSDVTKLWTLILDTALGVAVLSVLQKARDIWWFWPVHFAMDMMQFHAVAG